MRREYLELVADYLGMWARFDPDPDAVPVRGDEVLDVETNLQQLARKAMRRTGGNRTAAARLLGVNVKTLYNWMRKWEGE